MSKRQKKVSNLIQAKVLTMYLLQKRIAFEVTPTDKGWKVSFQCSLQECQKLDAIVPSSYNLADLLAARRIDANKAVDGSDKKSEDPEDKAPGTVLPQDPPTNRPISAVPDEVLPQDKGPVDPVINSNSGSDVADDLNDLLIATLDDLLTTANEAAVNSTRGRTPGTALPQDPTVN